MSEADKIGGKSVEKFLDAWCRHPLSIFLLAIVVTLTFVFLMLHNMIKDSDGLMLAGFTYLYSFSIILIVSILLIFKRRVLYNALDVLNNEIDHRIHLLQESLEDIEIELTGEPYEQGLQWLCPKAVTNPISDQTRNCVHIFEFLVHLQEHCGINKEIDDRTRLKLAKFYYREKKFDKALEYVDNVISSIPKRILTMIGLQGKSESECPAEAYFCRGLILKKLDREKESVEAFRKAVETGHALASCWICMLKVDSKNKEKIQEFIKDTESCPKSQIMKHCVNMLSSAYYKNAKLFPNDKALYLNKAYAKVETAIKDFDSWTAYYNKACDLSVMGMIDMNPYTDEFHDNVSVKGKMKIEALDCLKIAFQRKPALVVHSIMDEDLAWFKKNHTDEFNSLVGRVYTENHKIL